MASLLMGNWFIQQWCIVLIVVNYHILRKVGLFAEFSLTGEHGVGIPVKYPLAQFKVVLSLHRLGLNFLNRVGFYERSGKNNHRNGSQRYDTI